jgi:hypothetical protein
VQAQATGEPSKGGTGYRPRPSPTERWWVRKKVASIPTAVGSSPLIRGPSSYRVFATGKNLKRLELFSPPSPPGKKKGEGGGGNKPTAEATGEASVEASVKAS